MRRVFIEKLTKNNNVTDIDHLILECSREFDNEYNLQYKNIWCLINSTDGNDIYGLFIDDSLVGGFELTTNITDCSELPYLGGVIIFPEFRGKGYGRHLLNSILEVVRFRKLSKVYLRTKLVGFYEKIGFKKLDTDDKFLERLHILELEYSNQEYEPFNYLTK